MVEIWKAVPGYVGMYQVSNLGAVKRLFKNGKEHMLSGRKDKDGYIEVILSKNQTKKFCRVHRLVAEAFIPNADDKPMVNHKDKNVQNNAASNLEWVTASENTVHGYLTGRNTHNTAVEQYTKDMKYIATWDKVRDAASALKVSYSNISACCAGRLKSSGGYVWRYKGVSV